MYPVTPFWTKMQSQKFSHTQKLLTNVLEIEIGANSTVLKLQKWHAPKNKSQLTRKLTSTNMTQAVLLFFCMSAHIEDCCVNNKNFRPPAHNMAMCSNKTFSVFAVFYTSLWRAPTPNPAPDIFFIFKNNKFSGASFLITGL